MLPPLLMGTTLGTLADAVLPQWLIVTLLFVILSAMALRTGRKGIAAWRAEGRTRRSGGGAAAEAAGGYVEEGGRHRQARA
jgi:hypothetical protein